MMTEENIKKQLDVMENSIQTVLKKKYLMEGEESYEDMIMDRFHATLGEYYNNFLNKLKNIAESNTDINIDEVLLARTYCTLLNGLGDRSIIPGGSITFKLGNKTNASFSNCYYTPIESDSMEGIFETSTKLAKIFQYRGGSGIDLSILRPEGTHVNNSARTSSGPVSFMPKFASDADIVGQNGRRAALMISMFVWHPDIKKFIKSKAYPEEVFTVNPLSNNGLPDISTANISVKITPDFIEALEKGTTYKLRFPDLTDEHYQTEWKGDIFDWEAKGYKVIVHEEVDPNDIIELISVCAHKCGDPGLLNWKNTVDYSLGSFDERITPRGVNPCAEQSLPDYGNCLLSAINLSNFVINKWLFMDMSKWDVLSNFSRYYDIKGLREAVAANTLFLNLLIDNNTHPLGDNTTQDNYSRRIGIEFTALADTLAMLGLKYDTEEGALGASILVFTILDAALEFSNELSNMGITAPALNNSEQLANFLTQPILIENYKIAKEFYAKKEGEPHSIFAYSFILRYFRNILGDTPLDDRDNLIKTIIDKINQEGLHINEVGFANTSFNTVGPTGTISIVAGHVTSGIEPLFAMSYTRVSTVTDGKPIEILHYPLLKYIYENKAILNYITGNKPKDMYELNFTIREINLMDKFIESGDYKYLQELFYYVDSSSIDPMNRLALQNKVQTFVDASVSSTINLPEETTVEDIVAIYKEVLKTKDNRIKGVTIYRAGSKDGILVAKDTKADSKKSDNNISKQITIQSGASTKYDTENILDDIEDNDNKYNTVYKKKRATEEAAVSFCYVWKGAKIYITITVDSEGNPMEIFVNLPKEAGYITITQSDGTKIKEFSDVVYREHSNNWHLVCRLISLLLRTGCPVSEVMEQLNRATFNTLTDMAALVNRALSSIFKDSLEINGVIDDIEDKLEANITLDATKLNKVGVNLGVCPVCKKKTFLHSGGCAQCLNDECNYSKCS